MRHAERPWAALLSPLLLTLAHAIGIATAPCEVPITIEANTYPIAPVWIAGGGPYSMLVDTGTTVTQVSPGVAAGLRLEPTDRVTLSSPIADRTAGRVHVPVRVGSAAVDELETVITDLPIAGRIPSIDGVLGHNFLSQFDYAIDYRGRRLWLGDDGWRASAGRQTTLPLEIDEGRPILTAGLGDGRGEHTRSVRLILDSGASDVVLFESRGSLERTAGILFTRPTVLMTNGGTSRVETGVIARLTMGRVTLTDVRFAVMPGPAGIDGLLPARLLGAVSVSTTRGQISIF